MRYIETTGQRANDFMSRIGQRILRRPSDPMISTQYNSLLHDSSGEEKSTLPQVGTLIDRINYNIPKDFRKMLDHGHASLGRITEDVLIDGKILFLLFFKPEIERQFHFALLETTVNALQKLNEGKFKETEESAFFITQTEDGLKATGTVMNPADYKLRESQTGIIEEIKATSKQSIAGVHTHPPKVVKNTLAPSVIVEDPEKGTFGDLYSFFAMRQIKEKAAQQGNRSSFSPDMLIIILQEDWTNKTVEMLIIKEDKMLNEIDNSEYLELLRANQNIMMGLNQEGICRTLRKLGYRVSYLTKPVSQFYRYPFLNPKSDFEKIVSDLTR